MSKFIVECKEGSYVMSFIDDLVSTSTDRCSTMDEAIYEMSNIFNRKAKNTSMETTESMTRIKELSESGKLPIELIGINLINSEDLRNKISGQFRSIANEYLTFINRI